MPVATVRKYSHCIQMEMGPHPQMATVAYFGTGIHPRTGILVHFRVMSHEIIHEAHVWHLNVSTMRFLRGMRWTCDLIVRSNTHCDIGTL